MHVPEILTTLLLLTYRYIGLMIEQVSIMTESYALRAPNQAGIHFSAWGSFWGRCSCAARIGLRSFMKVCSFEDLQGRFIMRRYPMPGERTICSAWAALRFWRQTGFTISRSCWEVF